MNFYFCNISATICGRLGAFKIKSVWGCLLGSESARYFSCAEAFSETCLTLEKRPFCQNS